MWLLFGLAFARNFLLEEEDVLGVRVSDIEVHQEFVRYSFQLQDEILLVELQSQKNAGKF